MATKTVSSASLNDNIPQWKKDLIARLRSQKERNEERLWIDYPSHEVHHHPKTDIVSPSPTNGFNKYEDTPESSDSEDLHYGPGIVNKLRNKYLSLALRESSSRPSILRKATSLEHLLDEDDAEDAEKEDGRLFRRRGGGKDGGTHLNRYGRSSKNRLEMKRARSVETISRSSHDEDTTLSSSVTAKINNRQSLHEEMLSANNVENIENSRAYKKSLSVPAGEQTNRYNGRINRPKRIPPLLNEREKPPHDVVKHVKMIFEKRPEQRTKKPPSTGEVATKVESFNNIIVKAKVASKASKPPVKHVKPVLNDHKKSNTHHRVAKPVILSSEEIIKPKTLDLRGPKKEFCSLPSPIPDVSRVDIKNQGSSDSKNNSSSLCETPDLILTSSPLQKITSPTYKKRTTEDFLKQEINSSFLGHPEATNRYVSPIHSPTKLILSPSRHFNKPPILNFNEEEPDSPGIKVISPITQKNITKNSASSVFNFTNAQVDQRHLPKVNKNISEQKIPVSEPLNIEVNGFNGGNRIRMGLSAFEIEKNHKNAVKSRLEKHAPKHDETGKNDPEEEVIEKKSVKPIDLSSIVSSSRLNHIETLEETQKNNLDSVEMLSHTDQVERSWQNLGKMGSSVEKISDIFESLSKKDKTVAKSQEVLPTISDNIVNNANKVVDTSVESENGLGISFKTDEIKIDDKNLKSPKKNLKHIDKIEKIDRSILKPGEKISPSASDNESVSENNLVKIVFPKKTKPRVEETTTAVFNFTGRKDVPDYISNDNSRAPSKIIIPRPDEPGIKFLTDTQLPNFKEFQEVWEEDELIKSLEARPPSPCDVTFINDNILIDGKSSQRQTANKRAKQKISFIDNAEIFEYPSETSLLLEDSPLPSPLGTSAAQLGHTVPSLSGSTLATYTPKTTEDFQLGITRSIPQPSSSSSHKPDVADISNPSSDEIFEEIDAPVLFSSGSTSDILF